MKHNLILIFSIAATLISTSAMALTDVEKKADKDKISADYKAAHTLCDSKKGNAKNICIAEARGRERVALAEVDYKADATEDNRHKVAKAKADSDYEIATQKCDSQSGNKKDICKKEVKANHVKAIESEKVSEVRNEPTSSLAAKSSDISEARKDASKNVREAEYKAVVERCDANTGATKEKCVNDAKRQFGK